MTIEVKNLTISKEKTIVGEKNLQIPEKKPTVGEKNLPVLEKITVGDQDPYL